MSIDPKRIVEDEGASPLAAMLRAARDDRLTREEVDRIRAGLATAAVATGAGTSALVAKQTGTLASLSAKLGLALAVIGVATGGAWVARRDVATVAAPPAAGSGWDEATTPSSGVSAHPSAPSPPSDPVQSASSRRAADIAVGPPAAKAAPHPGRPTLAASTATAPQAPIARPASPPSVAPAKEGALLLEARRALGDDPVRALELIHEHERQFPNSQLAPERAQIEAEAAKRSLR
jgi:hypothetical protein